MIGRDTVAYKKWRISVFIRDKRECKKCGSKIEIQAHHIKPWSQFKDLRYEISNGVTLCKICHNKIHSKKGNEFFNPAENYNNQNKLKLTK